MSSHSPQRSRKPAALSIAQAGSMHNLQPRETSPSPSFRDRPRTLKAQSMPLVPSVMQVFAAGQQPPQGPQPSPTTSAPRRSPQLQAGQVQRGLPTPPHPTVPILPEQLPEPRIHSPSPLQHAHSQPNVNTHYPRPMRMPPHFLTNFQGMDQNWEMTDELLADIARADQQQSHGHTYSPSSYPTAAHPPRNTDSPPKDPGVERVRATGKSSPKDIDNRRQRDQQMARESPKNRDRQTTSPITSSLAQMQSQTPERRNSPAYHTPLGSPGELPQNYSHSPPIMRRPTIPSSAESRPSLSLSSQTPPSQATNPRSPDRSLPVQEEPEDDNVALRNGSHDDERENWNGDHTHRDHGHVSPTPSSDLNPEGHGTRYDSVRSQSGRNSRAGHREEDDDTLIDQNSDKHGDDSNSGGFTPRSPTANLPDIPTERYNHTASTRGRARTGATDQLGLRGFDPAVFDQTAATHDRRLPDQPPQYVEQRKLPQKAQQEPLHDPRARYYTPQIYPDELHNFMDHPTSAYIQAYLRSPRPDAPIPPTPHSQTSPPSPSPLMSSTYGHDLPPFSPVAPAGSPYPYPFTHVRRNHSYSGPNRHQVASSYDPNHPSVISEQMTKQYQMYAQNNLGHISDSTFSPSTTPFPTNYFNQWANWHTTKVLGGRVRDPMSISSSPSHEPISLPIPPEVGMKKKPRPVMRQPSARKPPPRVESTQPRETSPEPSSSGEETAGEEHFAVIEEGNWVHGGMAVTPNDDLGDWVDEDDEDDEDDLLELEYHPSFVNNVEKRRRRWETRWDALNQAFQALDRQTDATLVLMAAPSHTSKLHLVMSRSIRRQPALARSPMISSLRAGFRQVASQRRASRSHRSSLADRFLLPSNTPGDGSDGSSETREEDLKRALEAALGSLGALGGIYEQREARWRDEMRRISEDRERVEFLLRQTLGERSPSGPDVGQAL